MKWQICLALSMVVLTQTEAIADEFDFGTPLSSPGSLDPLESESWQWPLVLKTGLKQANQTSNRDRRLMFQGATISDKINWLQNGLKLHTEGTGYFNRAYRAESDPQGVIDEHELEYVLREGYLSQTLGPSTLGIGRKIIVFGRNDLLSLLDVVSPQDTTEAIFANPEDTRLGQDLAFVDIATPLMNIWLGASPQAQMNRRPAAGHPYDLSNGLEFPEFEKDPQEVYGRLSHSGKQIEWSLIAARTHNRDPIVVPTSPSTMRLEHHPLTNYGMGLTFAWQPLLLKSEVILIPDYPYTNPQTGQVETKRAEGYSCGVDYMSDKWGQWILESKILHDQDGQLKNSNIGLLWWALSYSQSFYQDNLTIGSTLIGIASWKDHIARFHISYRPKDDLDIQLSYTNIEMNRSELKAIEDFDRVEFGIYWFVDFNS